MIDIHTHILPGVDDGSQSMEDTIQMARIARDSGITKIVASCHCNIPNLFNNYYGPWYDEIYDVTKDVLWDTYQIELLPGMEVYATYDLPNLIDRNQVIPINQSRYMLIEFDFNEKASFAVDVLDQVAKRGLVPVIAHAERFRFIQQHPQYAFDFHQKGYVIQVNKGSFHGKFGRREKHTAYALLAHRLVHVIASDAHNYKTRTPYMRDVIHTLKRECSKQTLDILLDTNPYRICMDQEIFRFDAVPFR